MQQKMRAARIVQPGRVQLEEAPLPVPGAGEVRVRVEGSGLCASNLGPWQGVAGVHYPLTPGEGGHEGWGVVVELGAEVDRSWLGRRVAFLGHHGFAEHDVAKAHHLVALPATLEDTPFPGEAFACAMNIARRAAIPPGATVAVVGLGFLGCVVTRMAALAGARVLGISRRRFARERAAALGAERVASLTEASAQAEAFTGGAMCPVVIEAVGRQGALDLATELTAVRGRLVVAGYHQDGPRTVNMQQWNWKGLDVINAHERDPAVYVDGLERAITAVLEGVIDPSQLLTHRFRLEDLGAALDALAQRPHGFLKAVVMP
jgi:threonine dehydrogenase-like Zn-dependent dehydrogenase